MNHNFHLAVLVLSFGREKNGGCGKHVGQKNTPLYKIQGLAVLFQCHM